MQSMNLLVHIRQQVLETVVGARFGYGFQDISSGIADLEKTTQYSREIK